MFGSDQSIKNESVLIKFPTLRFAAACAGILAISAALASASGEPNEEAVGSNDAPDPDESALVALLRRLNDDGRRALLATARGLAATQYTD